MDYEIAKEFFNYDPDTGVLTWKVKACDKIRIGDVAGALYSGGYRRVRFGGKAYLAHRIIWLLTTGNWPENQIDHISGIPDDNRLCNLREATPSENGQNVKSRSNTGVSGVTLRKNGRYQANLMVNGKYVLNTDFKTFDGAVTAITEAKRKYHTFNPELVTR